MATNKKLPLRVVLKKSDFKAWIKAQPDTSVFFTAQRDFLCPIGKFVQANGGSREEFHRARENVELPVWAQNFIEKFDKAVEERQDSLGLRSMRVPAKIAKEVLKGI